MLSEVFRRFPDVPINIDVKVDDDRLVAEVVRLVAEFQRQHLTCWGNSSAVITDKLYAKARSRPVAAIGFGCAISSAIAKWLIRDPGMFNEVLGYYHH